MLVLNMLLAATLASSPKTVGPQNNGETSQGAKSYDAKWLLAYRGKTTNQVRWDPRFKKLLEVGLPRVHAPYFDTSKPLADVAFIALSGPPDDVAVEWDRYVTLAACVYQVGEEKGLLWVDTAASEPEMIFAALDESAGKSALAALYLYTRSAAFAEKLPPQFISSLTSWLTSKGIKHLTEFSLTGRSSEATHPPVSVLGAW